MRDGILYTYLSFLCRLPELDGALWARLELMCSENQYVDEWLPVFLTLIEVTRETIKVNSLWSDENQFCTSSSLVY